MARKEKEKEIFELTKTFKDVNLLYLINFSSLSVPQITNLRQRIRETKGSCIVAKKSLASLALKEAYLEDLLPSLENLTGVTGFVLGEETNSQRLAEVLTNFGREFGSFGVKAGYFGGRLISLEEIQLLARLPSRDAILAELISSLKFPLAGFLNLLVAPLRKFINVLNNIREKKLPRNHEGKGNMEIATTNAHE